MDTEAHAQILSEHEAAKFLGVDASHLRRWRRLGRNGPPASQRGPHVTLYALRDLEAFRASWDRKTGPKPAT